MQREFESSFKPYPATSLLHATHFYFLAIFSQLFENSACHLPLVLAHVTRSESKETTTVLIKQLHLHAMSLCAFTVLNFGLCFVVVVVAVVVVVVVVVAVVVVVVVLLLFLLLFAVLACIHYRGNVSLRPPLHRHGCRCCCRGHCCSCSCACWLHVVKGTARRKAIVCVPCHVLLPMLLMLLMLHILSMLPMLLRVVVVMVVIVEVAVVVVVVVVVVAFFPCLWDCFCGKDRNQFQPNT